jgi:hypothetical protein
MQILRYQFCKFPSIGGVPEGRGGYKNENEYENEYENKNGKSMRYSYSFSNSNSF